MKNFSKCSSKFLIGLGVSRNSLNLGYLRLFRSVVLD